MVSGSASFFSAEVFCRLIPSSLHNYTTLVHIGKAWQRPILHTTTQKFYLHIFWVLTAGPATLLPFSSRHLLIRLSLSDWSPFIHPLYPKQITQQLHTNTFLAIWSTRNVTDKLSVVISESFLVAHLPLQCSLIYPAFHSLNCTNSDPIFQGM